MRDVVASAAALGASRRASFRVSRLTRFGRRAAFAGVTVALVMATLGTTAAPAAASKKPVIPTQSQVDQANANAHAKAIQIGQTEAKLAAATASLHQLNDRVEALVEAYNGAIAKEQAAQLAVEKAQADLVVARKSRADAQVQIGIFAADTYRGAGTLDKISALMTADNPASFMSRASTLSALARHDQSIIATVTRTETEQGAAQRAATSALADQKAASGAAAKAKDVAAAALDAQVGQVASIITSQQDLQAQLAVLRGTAKDLASARTQGLARQAAEAAAAAKAAKAAKAARDAALAAAAAAAKKQADRARAVASSGAASGGGASGGGASGGGASGGGGSGGGDNGGGGGVVPAGGHSISTSAQRQQAVAFAQSQIGVWYRWAGAGEVGPTVTSTGVQNLPGYDCSGLTMRAYQSAGISLAHYTGAQWDDGVHLSRDQVQPGDLVFFATNTNDPSTIHHVGIYIGNGQMIDAPSTGEQIGVRNAFRSDYIGAVEL